MKRGLLTIATVSFNGLILGDFDRETEVKLAIKNITKNYSKTKTSHISRTRVVRQECTLVLTTLWDQATYDLFLSNANVLSHQGSVVIDSTQENTTIDNMEIESESFQSFGAKGGFTLTFKCLDRLVNKTTTEK